MTAQMPPRSIEWIGGLDGCARIIDQTLLPGELRFLDCQDVETIWEAIKTLRVRGAPAIGIAAAMGVVLGTRNFAGESLDEFSGCLDRVCERLAAARPTAVNLPWALGRMKDLARSREWGERAGH